MDRRTGDEDERSSPHAPSGRGRRSDGLDPENARIADALEEVADRLADVGDNPFRAHAYRYAAESVRQHEVPLRRLFEQRGREGLKELEGVGDAIAGAIEEWLHAERITFLERLRGETSGVAGIASVAGLGPELARRIHEELGVEDLFELEAAAWDGRLERVPGLGPARIRAVRESLAGRFQNRRRGPAPPAGVVHREPDVAELLDVDREYRAGVADDLLPKIAPKRFNPSGEAWLPVLRTRRGTRRYTALFSNTARAHEAEATEDWVVVYRDDGEGGQWTVVTAWRGPLSGKRVVRGHERECAEVYARESDGGDVRRDASPREDA